MFSFINIFIINNLNNIMKFKLFIIYLNHILKVLFNLYITLKIIIFFEYNNFSISFELKNIYIY